MPLFLSQKQLPLVIIPEFSFCWWWLVLQHYVRIKHRELICGGDGGQNGLSWGVKWGKQEGGLLGVHTSCHHRPVPRSSVASDRGSGSSTHLCTWGLLTGSTGTGTPHSRQVSTVTQSLAAACACMRKSDLVVDASDAFAFLRPHLRPSSSPSKKPSASHRAKPLGSRSNERKKGPQ